MIKVGLTGGIGTGKTVCASIFELLGTPIYYSDREAKKLMTTNKDIKTAITNIFGKDSFKNDGKLNRNYLRTLIFKDATLLKKMNNIVHPAVREHFRQWCLKHQEEEYVIQESALLIETKSYKHFDKIILVHASEQIRIKRVQKRDQSSESDIRRRIASQLPQEDKIKLADYMIYNDGSKSILTQILNIHTSLIQLSTA